MNNYLKKYLVIIALSLASSVSMAAPSFGGPQHSVDHNPTKMMERMTQQLNLNEQQQEQTAEILRVEGEAVKGERESLRALQRSLMVGEGEFDPGSAQDAADEIGAITARLAYSRASTFAQIRDVLTPEQAEQLKAFLASAKGGRERHKREKKTAK